MDLTGDDESDYESDDESDDECGGVGRVRIANEDNVLYISNLVSC